MEDILLLLGLQELVLLLVATLLCFLLVAVCHGDERWHFIGLLVLSVKYVMSGVHLGL